LNARLGGVKNRIQIASLSVRVPEPEPVEVQPGRKPLRGLYARI
jgi:hypothetical protein